ncbi:NAD-dependent protein deacylase [Clostridium gasigenes]|uniref:NAD-dependent protein deacetylase n=1 Tax=Clostridium gasigenes TaxID=94869 RepID=A0A1H0SPV9_9CLOT|nr:NAD-dependent protein deacylase [Clostridium gasigenes]MBU3089058.1 NAD-dependent protein deacylase [Clostridium gasigenes]MBU3104783.1 NAD-dependent protein deacylase [Clostridium gasigenes]MBU3133556.1 NAD-dependent protein deacylase [Clostridium gasigenes]MBU3137202.1 NAD-dependent protein deacylase [Clostridium gasigenes]NKF07811.1 NAD-dependent protein deacylase [Clostridium gasigenes]
MSIEKLSQIIDNSNNIVFFGGAGVSTESNIPDFRSATGLFNENLNRNFTPEQLVSHSFFFKHTEEFFKFYKDKLIYKNAKPNNAHISLAKLEEKGKLRGVITQNIDGLHQMAGSKNVLELHGSIHRNNCISCGQFYDLCGLLSLEGIIPHCKECDGLVKPDVVLYEEGLDEDIINKSIDLISNAEVLIIGGTSLMVYPAAGFIKYFKGKHLILINKSETQYDNIAEIVINEPIGRVLEYCVLK